MCNTENLKVGTRVRVRSGQYIITAEVLAITENGWLVRNPISKREYKVRRILEVVSDGSPAPATIPASKQHAQEEPPATEEKVQPPAESVKNSNLLEAAMQVLVQEQRPLGTREIVRLAIERQLWQPTACKTPEQSLYARIFTEIKTSKAPRFRKGAERGTFELA